MVQSSVVARRCPRSGSDFWNEMMVGSIAMGRIVSTAMTSCREQRLYKIKGDDDRFRDKFDG